MENGPNFADGLKVMLPSVDHSISVIDDTLFSFSPDWRDDFDEGRVLVPFRRSGPTIGATSMDFEGGPVRGGEGGKGGAGRCGGILLGGNDTLSGCSWSVVN